MVLLTGYCGRKTAEPAGWAAFLQPSQVTAGASGGGAEAASRGTPRAPSAAPTLVAAEVPGTGPGATNTQSENQQGTGTSA